MNPPFCHISNKPAKQFCIYPNCKQPAFICRYCQNDECENLHVHEGKLSISNWNTMTKLVKKYDDHKQKDAINEQLKRYEKQIQNLRLKLNDLIKIYLQKIDSMNKQVKVDEELKIVIQQIKKEKKCIIVGGTMKMAYDKLEGEKFVLNQEEMNLRKKQQSKCMQKILDLINNIIQNYKIGNIYDIQYQQAVLLGWSSQDLSTFKQSIVKIKQNHKNANAYFDIALIYDNNNIVSKAIYNYNKSLQIDQNYELAYYNRALLYKKNRQYEKAIIDANKYIQLNNLDLDGYLRRADIYLGQQKYKEALIDYEKVLSVDPQNKKALKKKDIICKIISKQLNQEQS